MSEVADTAKQVADDFFARSDAPNECEIKFALAASGTRPEERESVLYMTVRGINDQIRELDSKYKNGCELTVVNQHALPSTFVLPQIKSCGSAHWRRAELMAELHRKGSWALLLHEDGMFSEGVGLGASGWNIHAVVNETILTPPSDRAVDGTTKRYFKAKAHELGIAHQEIDISVDQILNADEVLITSSFIGIMPVSTVSGSIINCSNVWGIITSKLAKSFQEEFDLTMGGALDLWKSVVA